jgi:hypothetical protein
MASQSNALYDQHHHAEDTKEQPEGRLMLLSWITRWTKNPVTFRKGRACARPRLEVLEDRLVPATFTVETKFDNGSNIAPLDKSLRWAILGVDSSTDAQNTINFNLGNGAQRVTPIKPLPPITRNVTIDGSTVVGQSIVLSGELLVDPTPGLRFDKDTNPDYNANGSKILGVTITKFPGDGVLLNNVSSVQIGSGTKSVYIYSNKGDGVMIENTSQGNSIIGAVIGTDATSTKGLGNQGFGIRTRGNSTTIGGPNAADHNVLVDNVWGGIRIYSNNNNVIGNYIGMDKNGNMAFRQGDYGVDIELGTGNHIGTPAGTKPITSPANVISGFAKAGIFLGGSDTTANFVQGNFVGTNLDGTVSAPTPNAEGVIIDRGAYANYIGGVAVGAGNVIAASAKDGIHVIDNAHDNKIVGNIVGYAKNGTTALPNGENAIEFDDTTKDNLIQTNTIKIKTGKEGIKNPRGSSNKVFDDNSIAGLGFGIDDGTTDGVPPSELLAALAA